MNEYDLRTGGHPLNPEKPKELHNFFFFRKDFVIKPSRWFYIPEFQGQTTYRLLGSQSLAGQPTYVVGFAQKPGGPSPLGGFVPGSRGRHLSPRELPRISPDHRVMRLHTRTSSSVLQDELDPQNLSLSYRPYHFLSSPTTFACCPSRVTVSVEWGRRHPCVTNTSYSKLQLFDVEVHEDSGNGEPAIDAWRIPPAPTPTTTTSTSTTVRPWT